MSLRFNPVQCTSETFEQIKISPDEGYLYFVTDIKKIYLGKDGKVIPMAVSSGIFYGLKNIDWDDDGQEKPEEEIFKSYEIEDTGEGLPEKDDLILNTDGCFYRVTDINGDEFTTKRVTLRGSGGGGGGSNTPGGSAPSGGSFSITVNKNQYYASADTEMKFAFKGNYNGTDNNHISKVEFKLYDPSATDGKKEIDFHSVERDENGNSLVFNQEYNVYLYQFKDQFKDQQYIKIYMYDLYDNVKSATITLNIVDLKLTKEKDELLDTTTGVLSYTCGISSDVNARVITYSIYEQDNLITPIYKQEKESNGDTTISTNLQLGNLAHGVYVLQVQASASLSGTSKKLTSNILTHKVAVFKEEFNEPLLMVSLPDILEQYTNLPMHYKVVTKESNINYTLDIQVNKKSKVQQTVLSNNAGVYDLYFEKSGTYTLDVTVIELNLSYSMPMVINPYSGRIPVIDIDHEYLMLYLNPRDKSNSAVDRDIWADYRGDSIADLDTLTGALSGFHYGSADGWMKDSQGISYLQLSSGATLSLNKFRPFKTDLSKNLGLTIELDFEVNGVIDYDTALIQCISKSGGNTNVGFTITGDRITFAGSSASVSLNLVEGKRTRVSFVVERNPNKPGEFPLMYGYLNGKISAAKIYGGATFIDAQNNWATLNVTSNDAQVKIYGVRFYNIALDDRTILNNYTASLPTLEEREKSYASNNMVYSGSNISYDEVTKPSYDLGIPYMVLTGGYATEPEAKWQLKDFQNRGDGKLPTGKKDYRLVDVKVVYPDSAKYPFFANYQNYEFINEFAGGKPMKDAYSESPINGGAIMYAQGTSSMEYPIKNLRLRFKNAENWYRVKPDLDKVEIICMKADYMESSGSHNTGAANLVDALYEGMKIKTPGQIHFGPQEDNDGRKKIVTAIKGHPCLIFYSPTGENGTYEYIGKYNLNLDKATPEPFGFNHDDTNFGYLTDEEDKLVLDANGNKQNSIHCFEFLDNAVEVCNFMNKYKAYVEDDEGNLVPDPSGGLYSYEDTWYNTFIKDAKQVPGWTLGFESRYPEDLIGSTDADSLYPLASWINELYSLRYGLNGVTANEATAKSRFLNEYWKYLDHDFTLVYYLLTEALLMADNRVKNMMIATWGKEHRYFNPTTKEILKTAPADMTGWQHHFGYIFYPIFYDMDTMMGLDNTGVYRFNYYDEDTNPNIFNGEEVLWNFVRDSIPVEQKQACYRRMEEALLYVSKDSVSGRDLGILSYFNDNQANMANEAFYNGDAKYKYIEPAIEGYHDDLNNKDIAAGAGPFLYAAQGDRSLMREWFISNRIKFLQGKYKSKLFQSGDRIEYRQYYPTGNIPDEFAGHEATLTAVEPSGTFNLTSVKTGYAGILLGANGELTSERFNDEETKPIIVTNMSLANGTEAYIVGLSNLSDLGDMSNKYIQKFIIASSDVRLKNLTLGNPHKDYYNPYWGTSVKNEDGSSDSPRIDVSKAIYLQSFNLQNCSQYTASLDFSNCKAIETILLTGSGVKDLKLPVGSIIKELRIPTSVTKIDIESCATLEPNMFSIGGYDYEATFSIDDKFYDSVDTIQNDEKQIRRYLNDYSAITSLRVIDTNINTYTMACEAKNLDNYCLRGVDWTITSRDTQYCLRENSNSLTAEQIKSYYTYDAESDEYTIWGKETYPTETNVFLYEKVDMVNSAGKMVSIPILDQLQTKRLTADSSKHAEALTGKITINVSNITANELEIYEKYINVYPNLEIVFDANMSGVTRAYRVKFYRAAYQEGIDTTNLVPYFSRLTNGTKTLKTIITDDLFSNPTKSPSADTVYNFSGDWVDVLDNNKSVYSQFTNGNANSFDKYQPKKNMDLLPKFNAETRIYDIKFYENDGATINDIVAEGTYLTPVLNCVASADVPKVQYRYKSDEGLAAGKRWSFKGWINEVDYNALQTNSAYNPTIQNLATLQVASNLKLYAHYIIEDAATVPSDEILFEIVDGAIAVKPQFINVLAGKITVPSSVGSVIPNTLGNFKNCTLIKELYFLNGAPYTHINNECFMGNSSLKQIYNMPNIVSMGEAAFNNCRALELSTLPATLQTLGPRVFWNCEKLSVSKLPDSVIEVGVQCFLSCSNVTISTLGGKVPQLIVGYMAFSGTGQNNSTITTVTINEGVELRDNNGSGGFKTFNGAFPQLTVFKTYSTFGYSDEAALAVDLFGRTITSCGPLT